MIFSLYCQTQNCDWRNPSRRKRRELTEDGSNTTVVSSVKTNDSLSENLSLFQAIHVLQSEDDDGASGNQSSASSFYKTEQDELARSEDTICIESMMFASVIGE